MQIIRDEKYIIKLQSILEFIAKDSFDRANQFKSNLDNQIDNLECLLIVDSKHFQ